MSDFKSVFEKYGMDYDLTMDRFLNNEELYQQFLVKFFEDENMQLLGDSLKKGDLDVAFAAAHTLKGVAGNLGLAPVSDEVVELVEHLRVREQREDYPEMYARLKTAYDRIYDLQKDLQA